MSKSILRELEVAAKQARETHERRNELVVTATKAGHSRRQVMAAAGFRSPNAVTRILRAAGLLAVLLMVAGSAKADAAVLAIGDSHTYITGLFVGMPPAWEVDAEPGRDSTEALATLRTKLRVRHDRVVFDISTNDRPHPGILSRNLESVWREIGPDRRLTLVTTFAHNAPGSELAVNTVLERFAARHPQRVRLVQWDDAARVHPDWYGDGLHFNIPGYTARVSLVRRFVRY